ncbi:ATP-binding cassette domain-containing protein [Methylomonas sp. MgM2]
MGSIINVQNLDFSYGFGELQRPVLKKVGVTIGKGEIVIMTGPSGSGKTTFLTIIGGLRQAMEGSVSVLGKQLINSDEKTKVRIRRQTGYIFQQHNLLKSLTALQNVSMALEIQTGLTEKKRSYLAEKMLDAVGLSDRLHHKPEQLSGGQRQRVSIARALVGKPKIVLADEPTASLDKQSGLEAVNILKHLAKESNTTILLVTHDYRILDVADRIVELEDGIIKNGMEDIYPDSIGR